MSAAAVAVPHILCEIEAHLSALVTAKRAVCIGIARTPPPDMQAEEFCHIHDIRVCAQLAVEEKRLRSVEKEKREVQLQTLKQEIRSYQTLQQQITEESRILYEAYAMDGSMSRTEYADKKAALLARREKACEDEAAAKQRLESLWNGESKFIEKYKGLTDLDKLTAELAADLLRFIKIWPDGRVNVELNYLDEIPHAVVRNLLAAI